MDKSMRCAAVFVALVLVCGCITIEDTDETTSTSIKFKTLAEVTTTTSTTTSTTQSSTSTTAPSCSTSLDPLSCEQSGGLIRCTGGVCACQCTTTTKATTTTTRGTTKPTTQKSTTTTTSPTSIATSSTTTSSSTSSSSTSVATSSSTSTTIKERQCTDVDQVNIFKKSYIVYEAHTYEDYCEGVASVVEMYCIMNSADGQPMMASQVTSCPSGFGCTDGACWPMPTTTVTTRPKRTPPCGQYGDVNGDGFVTAEDVQQLNVNTPLSRGDVSGNGQIDLVNDAFYIAQYYSWEIDIFLVCN